MSELKEINHTEALEADKEYPFRASLTKIARCGMCRNGVGDYLVISCSKNHKLVYPLICGEHECPDYEYKPDHIEIIPEDKTLIFTRLIDRLLECNQCSHLLYGRCTGVKWDPFKIKDGKCEFFRDKSLICKHAIPYLQYGNHHRNNFCTLPPEERDGDTRRGWKWNCPGAHEKDIEYKKCYQGKLK